MGDEPRKVLGWLANFTLRTQLRNRGRLDLPGLPGFGPFGSTYSGPLWTSALVLLTIASVCVVLAGMIVRRRELVLSR